MENKYYDKLLILIKQAKPRLKPHHLTFKNVFGAVAGYVDDCIFISCGTFGVALKLPPEILDKVFNEKDVKYLKYFSKGHIKKEYVVLPKRIIDDIPQFKKLIDKSIEYALRCGG